MNKQRMTTRELTTLAMLTAIAYALVCTVRIPIVLFLKYEPKDVVITIGGFLLGPMAALISSLVVILCLFMEITSKQKLRTEKNTQGAIESQNLLPSRLYCRYWNHTNSAIRLADCTAGRESHPALKILCSLS